MSRIKKRFSVWFKGFLNNPVPFLLIISLLLGIIIGTLYVRSSLCSPNLENLLKDFLDVENRIGFWQSILRTVSSILPFYILSVLLTFCSIGIVIRIFIPFMFSLGYGVLFGYIFNIYAFNGFLYVLIILALPFALTAILLIFSLKESYRISRLQFRFLKSNGTTEKETDMHTEMRLTAFRQFFFLIFLTVSAFMKSVLLISFRNMIKL